MYSLQLTLEAYDSIYPDNRAVAPVTITVLRNPNEPKFRDGSYSVTIDEKIGLGAEVIQLQATDRDEVTSAGGV